MDKRRAIQIMTKASQLYKENLEDQKVLFLYGLLKVFYIVQFHQIMNIN